MQTARFRIKPHVPHRGKKERRCAFPALSVLRQGGGTKHTTYDFEWLDLAAIGRHVIQRWECEVHIAYGFFEDPVPNKFRPSSQLEVYRVEMRSESAVFVGRHFYSKKLPAESAICWLYRWIPNEAVANPSGWYTWVAEKRYPALRFTVASPFARQRDRNVRATQLEALYGATFSAQ